MKKKTLFSRISCAMLHAVLLTTCASVPRIAEDESAIHVVLIGLDAWGAYSVPGADIPVIRQMMAHGAYTLEDLSVMPSDSAPNWMSMFSGADPGLHGFTSWNSKEPGFQPAAVDSRAFFPGIFGLLRDQKPESTIAYFYEWSGMKYLVPKDVPNRMKLVPLLSYWKPGANKIARYIKKQKPGFAFIGFYGTDMTGHSKGHDTPAYYKKLSQIDGYIGIIEQAVKDAGIYDNTIFILTADHGGVGKGHGGESMQERQVPLILYGKGIKKGYEIVGEVHTYDTASTIARIFGLVQPDVWIGKPVEEAFE
ncbi:alkaline phosphatase [Leadbettera azotonutricia]|uniref:Putative sulfatase n=1 Tax=Leadbettera azotonutricia (strain ATCC BAA-888 / DSM 13862 / ZAS-9) TaxID=545695 RepID=F5YDE4_LEAAZ|nr:alkaline phosphatase [Leadbettera azotonutricia]AEF80905.1 putative sulfatase [Leadbettera azotonutricia ZAS-9]